MDESATRPGPQRRPRLRFAPDPRLTGLTVVLCGAAAAAAVLTGDGLGRLLFGAAAILLAGYAAVDLVYRPRLAIDAAGLRVRGPGMSARLAWADVGAVRADVRNRHGLRTSALEIDAGQRLIVLTRRALGADPEQVAELARAFDPRLQ